MAEDFRFKIEDAFSIQGRGTVVKGRIYNGRVYVDDYVSVDCINGQKICKVLAIESDRKMIKEATQGGSVGLLLSGIEKSIIKIGDSVSGLTR